MKSYILLLLTLLSFSFTNAQLWLDKQCKISDQIKSFELEAASKRDVLTLLIDQEGKLLANGKDISFLNETRFKEYIYNFIANPDDNPQMAKSPKKAIISIQHYQHPKEYEARLEYIREVYYFLWNLDANDKYKEDYINLDCKKREKIQRNNPYRVFEVSKQKPKKKDDGMPQFVGPPPFEGDVKDN
jgi:hypothetical protein